ncbi:MAG: hypothetical protein H7Z20_04650 [Bdellovibrio sp.]|nr:hypothetical protein [Methylotenera sp.]
MRNTDAHFEQDIAHLTSHSSNNVRPLGAISNLQDAHHIAKSTYYSSELYKVQNKARAHCK